MGKSLLELWAYPKPHDDLQCAFSVPFRTLQHNLKLGPRQTINKFSHPFQMTRAVWTRQLVWWWRTNSKKSVATFSILHTVTLYEVLRRLRENVRRKRPDQWQNNIRLLHHDNAPAHAALLTRRFLTDNNMTVVPHPSYSPDHAPSDFFLFSELKMKLKKRRFQTVEEIQADSQAVLNTLGENDFQECFKPGSAAGIVVKPHKGTTLKVMPAPNV